MNFGRMDMRNRSLRTCAPRVEKCRRLAKYINDPRTTKALLQMADDGEADIRKLEGPEAKPDDQFGPTMPGFE